MNKGEMLINIVIGIALFIYGIEDIKTKKISTYSIIIASIILIIIMVKTGNTNFANSGLGFLLGPLLIVISIISRGQIGIGDGFVLCFTGIGLGINKNLYLFFLALCASALYSAILLVFHKADRKTTIPFIPFLFIGFCGVTLL